MTFTELKADYIRWLENASTMRDIERISEAIQSDVINNKVVK